MKTWTQPAACWIVLALLGCGREPPASDHEWELPAREDGRRSRGAGDDSLSAWSKADAVRKFRFPRDHAAHEDYRIEWWYYTGNLESTVGRRFGYQLTFFRTGVNYRPRNPSRWAVRDLYTAHFAVSDIERRKHRFFERTNRRGVGLAGARTDRYSVWNGDWKAVVEDGNHHLKAHDSGWSVDLRLSPVKPLVLHGENGLSRKGGTSGNASYYYSYPRMATEGTIRVDGETFRATGTSWMDHEFSTSFLEEGQAGWDWFAIQLDNGAELMLYQIRRDDGTADEYSSGTYVDEQGTPHTLNHSDFSLQPARRWRSPTTGGLYPLVWHVAVPAMRLTLNVRPAFDAQEMATQASAGIAYWEGSIQATGTAGADAVQGRGYVELTGYAGKSLGALFEAP